MYTSRIFSPPFRVIDRPFFRDRNVSGKVFVMWLFHSKMKATFVSTKWGSPKDCISRLWMSLEGFQAAEKGNEGFMLNLFLIWQLWLISRVRYFDLKFPSFCCSFLIAFSWWGNLFSERLIVQFIDWQHYFWGQPIRKLNRYDIV